MLGRNPIANHPLTQHSKKTHPWSHHYDTLRALNNNIRYILRLRLAATKNMPKTRGLPPLGTSVAGNSVSGAVRMLETAVCACTCMCLPAIEVMFAIVLFFLVWWKTRNCCMSCATYCQCCWHLPVASRTHTRACMHTRAPGHADGQLARRFGCNRFAQTAVDILSRVTRTTQAPID